eukprot:349632-Chlamydomonas_euryale.AAC.4
MQATSPLLPSPPPPSWSPLKPTYAGAPLRNHSIQIRVGKRSSIQHSANKAGNPCRWSYTGNYCAYREGWTYDRSMEAVKAIHAQLNLPRIAHYIVHNMHKHMSG